MNPGEPFNPYKMFTGIFVPEAICRSDLSAGAKLVYGRLCRYAGEDGRAYPSIPTLGAELGISGKQARRYVLELESRALIRPDRAPGKQSQYVFLWHAIFEGAPLPKMGVPGKTPPIDGSSTPPIDGTPIEGRQRESDSLRESVKNSSVYVRPRAAELDGPVSQRFAEFWERYPRQTGQDAAAAAWVSVVTTDNEERVFACLDRYLQSAEVARGAVMNAGPSPDKPGWLMSCARDGWACNWPAAGERAGAARNGRQAAIDREWEAIANGER